MTRRILTAEDLHTRFAPGDVHMVDHGFSTFVDEDVIPEIRRRALAPVYVPANPPPLEPEDHPLPDWARTVIEMPRRGRCGRLVRGPVAWATVFCALAALLLGALALLLLR